VIYDISMFHSRIDATEGSVTRRALQTYYRSANHAAIWTHLRVAVTYLIAGVGAQPRGCRRAHGLGGRPAEAGGEPGPSASSLAFGRIVASEIEAPNVLANLV
jgi:hypothetical protein